MSQAQNQRRQTGVKLTRELPVGELSIRQIDEAERTVELSFSSETPVTRWYWTEILCHDEGCVDLARLSEIGVTLFNHSSDYVLGKVISCEIDAESQKGRAVIQFDDDPDADKIYRKVLSGTLKGVSVGYRVDVWEEVEKGATSTNGRFTGPCDVAVRWTPYEVSIVSVPADASVGVGRSEDGLVEETRQTADISADLGDVVDESAEIDSEIRAAAAAQETGVDEQRQEVDMPVTNEEAVATVDERQQAIEAERTRASEITTLCREFDRDPAPHISAGDSVDAVRKAILDEMRKEEKPVGPGGDVVQVTRDAVDTFREAASHALVLRAGLDLRRAGIEKPHAGANELRGMSIRSIAEEYLRMQGLHNASRLSVEELMKRVFTPDSQFAGILDDTIGHSMMIGHTEAGTSFQAWAGQGSNTDFKSTPKFRMSEASEPEIIGQNGEFTMDEMSDEGVNTQVHTYGKMWGFSRQAMVNDDLKQLTSAPAQYARACMRKINTDVYAYLNDNPAIYDGIQLFDTDHGNLATSAGAPSVTTLGAGRAAMRKQTALRGDAKLNVVPRFLIVGVDIETVTEQLQVSLVDPSKSNSTPNAAFIRNLQVISDAEITDGLEWFLAASPQDIDTIEVTTLNGNLTPIIESQVGFTVLGMMWRLYLDWGVTVLDYRGLYNNAGH